MPIYENQYLINKDAKDKIRIFHLFSEKFNDCLIIHRETSQLHGKVTKQPDLLIDKGLAGRSIIAQYKIRYNHLIKEKLDKGYKRIDKDPQTYSLEELKEIVGDYSTNQDGLLKPMLAKSETQVTNRKIFDKDWYASRKINGIRTLVYFDGKEIHTASRGGAINYDFVLDHIIHNPVLVDYFTKYPDLIFDCETYKHGWTLNKISGICRTQKTAYDGEPLELYVYDIVDVNKTFKERLQILNRIQQDLNLSFIPERDWDENDLKIQIVPHVLISGWDNIKKLHDEWVSEGWEGVVIRDPNVTYKPGGRGNQMLKIKNYIDAEYKIIGLTEGLREEDMCFLMETPEGQQFNCKPMGDRAQKKWYREHIDELIGKMATIKYFEMSGKEGSQIPQQPVMISIRDYE